MMQRYVQRVGVAGLLVLAGSASGQTTFSGNDLGRPFTFTGISPNLGGSPGAGVNDGSIGTRSDAFDNAGTVTVNGVALASTSFSESSNGALKEFTQDLGGGLFAGYTLAFRADRAVVRIDVRLINRGDNAATFDVVMDSNLGSDAGTSVYFTSDGNSSFSTSDRWVVTDETTNPAGGDPAVLFVFGGTDGGVAPTSVSQVPSGTIGCRHIVSIDPFDDRMLSYFLEIDPNASDAGADGPDYNTLALRDSNNFFSPNFFGRSGQELNFDTYRDWDGSSSNDLTNAFNWDLNSVPTFEPARIRSERDAFLPEGAALRLDALDLQGATIDIREDSFVSVTGRFVVDDSSVIELDGGSLFPAFPLLSDGTISVRSPGALIGDEGSGFPSLRNSGLVEVVGIPFSPEFASLEITDDALNLDQWILRGAAELKLDNQLENRANFDIVFANAVMNGDLFNTASGLTTVSGASQFNQVGDVDNDGTFVVSSDSSYSLLGSLSGNGVEGPGGAGTAGTVFIRDGVSGRSGGTNRIAFDGQLGLGANAVTTIRIGGTSPGVGFDQLAVAGALNAAGTIRFESVNGFVPQPGDVFDVLDFGSIQGTFAAIEFDATLAAAGLDTSSLLVDGTIRVPADCLADTNGDGSVTPADFNAWIIAFNTQSPACDQNGDGVCSPADFNAWIINFNAGCP